MCLAQERNKQACPLVVHTISFDLSVKQGNCESLVVKLAYAPWCWHQRNHGKVFRVLITITW